MVGEAVAPVRAVQLLEAVELGVAIEKEELRGVEVAVVIDLVPATLGYIDGILASTGRFGRKIGSKSKERLTNEAAKREGEMKIASLPRRYPMTSESISTPGKAIILAAGTGTRLRPFTDTMPKCLVPVNGTPILINALTHLSSAGIRDAVIVVGYP